MTAEMVVIDGVRYRLEEAKARGLLGERPVPGESRALSLTAAQVDVDALVEARVSAHEAELEQAHAARRVELEQEFDARVADAVAEAIAGAKSEQPASDEQSASTPAEEPPAKDAEPEASAAKAPANKGRRPANK